MEIDRVSQSHINRFTCRILGIQHDFRVNHRNYASYHKDKDQIVHTDCKESQNHAGYHFLTFHFIEQHTGQSSKYNSQNSSDQRSYDDSRKSINTPVSNKDQANLSCHRSKYNTEIQAHAAHNRQDQGND